MNVMTAVQFRSLTYKLEEDMPSDNGVGMQVGIDDDGDGVVDDATGELSGQSVPDEGPYGDGDFIMHGRYGQIVKFELVDLDRTTSFVQPKFGVNYNVNQNFNVFGNVSLVRNEPDLGVFYNYGRPHPDPKDEKLTDLELGFGWNRDPLRAKVNFYQMKWSDKSLEIEDPSKAGEPGYSRTGERTELIGSSQHRGVELEWVVGPYADGWGMRGSFTWMRNVWDEILDEVKFDDDGEPRVLSENEETGEDFLFKNLGGKHVASGPQTMLSFGLTCDRPDYFGGLDFNWYGRYYALDGDLPIKLQSREYSGIDKWSSSFRPFWLVNVRAGYNLPIDDFNATISAQIYNLFDKEYLVDADSYGVIPGGLRTIRVVLAASI